MAHVLVLEDDPDQLEMRKLLLESAGHRVSAVSTAIEACLQADAADVLVLDLVPAYDEVLNRLPAATPVIVLSGRQGVSETVAARAACVLRKPCSSKTLIETIARLSHGHNRQSNS